MAAEISVNHQRATIQRSVIVTMVHYGHRGRGQEQGAGAGEREGGILGGKGRDDKPQDREGKGGSHGAPMDIYQRRFDFDKIFRTSLL